MKRIQNERFYLGKVEVGGKVNVESVTLDVLDNHLGEKFYEVTMTIDIKMVWNDDIQINHLSRLRWNLNSDEIAQLKEKGLIRISKEKMIEQLKNDRQLSKPDQKKVLGKTTK